MAKMPNGSSLIYNPSSGAPGFKIRNVLCLPGVPTILKSMIGNTKKFLIKGKVVHDKNINLITVESNISLELEKIQNSYANKNVNIGSYPFFKLGKVGVCIVLRSDSKTALTKCFNDIKNLVNLKKIKIFK